MLGLSFLLWGFSWGCPILVDEMTPVVFYSTLVHMEMRSTSEVGCVHPVCLPINGRSSK